MNTIHTEQNLVSTKFISSRYYSTRVEHYCYNCDSKNTMGRRNCHEYVYPVSFKAGNNENSLRYEGAVRVYIKELSHSIWLDDTVEVVFDIECFKGEQWQWGYFQRINTDNLSGFRIEDAEDEDFGYFLLGRIALELRIRLALEIFPNGAKAALKMYAEKTETEIKNMVPYLLEMKHWMSDINADAKTKLWRANSDVDGNRDGKFITYTKIEGSLNRDDLYFINPNPEVKERYPEESEI